MHLKARFETQKLLVEHKDRENERLAGLAQALASRQRLDEIIEARLIAPAVQITNSPVFQNEVRPSIQIGDIERATNDLIAELEKRLPGPAEREQAARLAKILERQASLPPPNRKPPPELKEDFNALEKLAAVATLWQTWGSAISKALGF